MTKMLRRKTKLTQHGVTDEMSPRYTKELERQEAKKEIMMQLDDDSLDFVFDEGLKADSIFT